MGMSVFCRKEQEDVQMTRKQAMSEAISILSKDSKNEKIVEKLQEILCELPMSTWTKKSILDAIENYAIEHNNTLPYERELTSTNHMPSNTVIYNLFGISAIREFYSKYFSNYLVRSRQKESPYENYSQEDFVKIFIQNYARIKKELNVKSVNYKTYDFYKEKNSPCVNTILRNCNCDTYNDLLILCQIKHPKKKLVTHISITYNDDNEWHKETIDSFTKLKRDHQ